MKRKTKTKIGRGQNRAQRAIQHGERHFQRIFEMSMDAIFIVDPFNDTIIDVNPAACKMLGYTYDELLRTPMSAIHPHEMPKLKEFAHCVYQGGSCRTDQLTCAAQDGRMIPADIAASRFVGDSGDIYLMAVVRNNTERMAVERELQNLAKFPAENPFPVMRISFSGQILYANKAGDFLLDQWQLRSGDFAPPAWKKLISEAVLSCRRSRMEVKTRDRFFLFHFVPIPNEEYVNVYGEDLTDIRHSEEKFRQLVENIKEIFYIISPDGSEIIYVSPVYEEVSGRTCQSLYENPMSWIDAIHPEDRDRVVKALDDQANGTYSEEFRISRPDGTIRWIWDRSFPVKNEAGKVYRIVGIGEDITAIKEAESNLREAQMNLVQSAKLAVLGQMSAGITHELNQPLASIQIYVANALTFLQNGKVGEVKSNMRAIAENTSARAGWSTAIFRSKALPGPCLWTGAR